MAPYLNGMSEAIGEGRRAILDLLRRGEVAAGERILAAMDDIYALLVTVDYPDAITGNLRRSTDVARGILERTRGDLTMSLVQGDLRDALDRHARGLRARLTGAPLAGSFRPGEPCRKLAAELGVAFDGQPT